MGTLTGERGARQTCQQGCGGSLQPRIASPSVSAEKMSQGWSQTRGWLRAALARHQLLFVNCGVSVGLSGLGDLLQQRIEQGRQTPRSSTSLTIHRSPPSVNWSRTVNMSTSFGLTAGVLCHHWYRVLDNFLPGRTLRPICIAACIFVSGTVFEAKSSTQIMEDT